MSRRIHRSSGAQPGNHNALKHGFYSKFRTIGRVDHVPARAAARELDHDIALTRATLRDLLAHDPHNAKLIAYTLSLHARLLRNRQTIIDCDRRAKRRQRSVHPRPGSADPATRMIAQGMVQNPREPSVFSPCQVEDPV